MFAILLSAVSLFAVQVLDTEMDPSEKKKTGISKLSDKEKAGLIAWIDNHYAKRSEPLAAKTLAEYKSSLAENLQNGNYIRLDDNTTWNIRPQDTPISQGWITPVDILISQSGDPQYPSKLTNSLTGSFVFARKIEKSTYSNPSPAPAQPMPSESSPPQQ